MNVIQRTLLNLQSFLRNWKAMIRQSIVFLFVFIMIFSSSIIGEESLAITIYNNDFAMVKDVRKISFDKGESTLYFTDVSENIQTQTVTFKATRDPTSVTVYEQNFQKNLINSNGILKKYIQKDVDLYIQLGGQSRRVSGKLLGYNSGYILQTSNGIKIFNKIAGIQFPSLPDGFFTTPTLNWKVFSKTAQITSCEVAYRTNGFKWSADYSLVLNQQETNADVGGWVTIDNNSGKKYVNTKLKLIAGEVNIAPQQTQHMQQDSFDELELLGAAPPAQFAEKSFADYHMYTFSKPVTINQSSQKQIQFIPKVYNISVEKYHQITVSTGGFNQQNSKPQNYVKFSNSKNNGLGIPFPKGTVRVFKQDKDDGSLQFIGQNSIEHTPKDENITIYTGNAFDIVTKKIAKNRINLNDNESFTADLIMNVTNKKQVKADVVIILRNDYGDNLNIKSQKGTPAPEKVSASQFRWRKVLKPDQVWTLKWKEDYTAQ